MAENYPSSGSPVPQVLLNLRQGPIAGQTFSLSAPTIFIGRKAGNDVVINDAEVSRRHACISWDGHQFVLTDMGSANGTFVNGMRLTGPHVLGPGDAIGLGTTVLLGFQAHIPAVGPPPPPVTPTSTPVRTPASGASGGAAKTRSTWPWVLAGFVVGLLVLVAIGGLVYFLLTQRGTSGRLVVLIEDPQPGAQVSVGDAVNIHAVARHPQKVERVELWVDGQMVAAKNSSLPGGTSPFPLLAVWQPASPGTHTLIARAFDTGKQRAQASITVVAAAGADRDGDGTADDLDACPDQAGSSAAQGCPDADGDGIPDAQDACPDLAGLPVGNGCPAISEGDRDGDGMMDAADACPDVPGSPTAEGCPDGDGDGVADSWDACPSEPGVGDDGCPAGADTDGDGLVDGEDACPTEPGSIPADGCPDADGDGVPDATDACPDVAGPPPDGCPLVADGDRDGDTILDAEDACPDDPGPPWSGGCPDRDGDGVPDATDACPDTPGPASNGGCPTGDLSGDADGDGVPDSADACPDTPGPAETGGCPDTDGDGVVDSADLCPTIPGTPENAGCPAPPGSTDTDGDGIIDELDMCPTEPGPPENAGCPAPGPGGGDDDDGSGPIPLWPPPGGGIFTPITLTTQVEFQALSYHVDGEYDEMACYVSLVGADRERYELDPLGAGQWDIAAHLGGDNSRQLLVPLGEPASVVVECGGQEIFLFPGWGWGTYWDLGDVAATHPPEEWDGRILSAASTGGDAGRSYEVTYRLCAGTCNEVLFRPPDLHLYHDGSGYYLMWIWDGDREQIDGFKMYINGNAIRPIARDQSTFYVNEYQPECGSMFPRFQLTTYRADAESPLSNEVHWTPDPCARLVRVTFDSISTGYLGDDEWWAHGESVGPIYGSFWAQGANSETLSFHAAYPSPWWGGRPEGYRLRHTRYYPVQNIFDWISTQMTSCMGPSCAVYSGPAGNTVEIELGPYDDLTFGAGIYDFDTGNPDDTLFQAEHTLASSEILPGLYHLEDRNIELDVLIDMLVGPEAGDLPDLMITNVELVGDPGQMRITVFNTAADMSAEDLTVHVVNRRTGDVVLHETWPGQSIPSGGVATLQTLDTFATLSDLRLILDPDNAIPEMNDGNNIYETPVTVRVGFLGVADPGSSCNENSCSIFDCDSEHVFRFWTGYGPDAGHIMWVAHNVRFPRSGELIACNHPICERHASPDGDWNIAEGDERYTFEFDVPIDENVYVSITGVEVDHANDDDSMGRVFDEYTPYENWGGGADIGGAGVAYHASSGSSSCDDTFCSECDGGLTASWKITRVR